MGNNVFGIDLGTSNIKIFNKNEDKVTVEKNIIAIENKTNILAYGDSAYDMYEKTPPNIQISYPLSNGVIADIDHMKSLVKLFITNEMKGVLRPADVYIAVPKDVTEVERRAFHDLIHESGIKAKKIMLVRKPVADGLGMGVDVMNSQGVLVVNVGYDTTEISILSLKGIVISKLIKVGGKKFDDS
nr:rod shape-determining protein [Butyrivibrio sp.]